LEDDDDDAAPRLPDDEDDPPPRRDDDDEPDERDLERVAAMMRPPGNSLGVEANASACSQTQRHAPRRAGQEKPQRPVPRSPEMPPTPAGTEVWQRRATVG